MCECASAGWVRVVKCVKQHERDSKCKNRINKRKHFQAISNWFYFVVGKLQRTKHYTITATATATHTRIVHKLKSDYRWIRFFPLFKQFYSFLDEIAKALTNNKNIHSLFIKIVTWNLSASEWNFVGVKKPKDIYIYWTNLRLNRSTAKKNNQ